MSFHVQKWPDFLLHDWSDIPSKKEAKRKKKGGEGKEKNRKNRKVKSTKQKERKREGWGWKKIE